LRALSGKEQCNFLHAIFTIVASSRDSNAKWQRRIVVFVPARPAVAPYIFTLARGG